MKKPNSGQAVSEYFITFIVILAAILAIGFIGRVKGVFSSYFTKASDAITVNK